MDRSGTRSPFSPRVRQSLSGRRPLGLQYNKKNQSKFMTPTRQSSEVILKTQNNSVESFGLPLPVLVTETLTFAKTSVKVKLSSNGWCWLVCGRKLLVWQYHETRSSRSAGITSCRELLLPQTDLAYKADLVSVFIQDGNQMPSCIGVSPEGIVRYWPSIIHEGTYSDESAELQGQECDMLTDVMPIGCVLVTTSCTLVIVQPVLLGNRQSVNIRTLRAPSGWLGGLGRRVSLLFFGSMPSAQMLETKLIGVSVLDSLTLDNEEGVLETRGPYIVCMAAGPCLQLWRLPQDAEGEKLMYEIDLRRSLRDVYVQAQLFPQNDTANLEVFVLDMQPFNNGLMLLMAAVNLTRSPDMRYALGHIVLDENPTSRVSMFTPLKLPGVYRDDPKCEAMSLRFVNVGTKSYLYTEKELWVVSSVSPNEKHDYMELGTDNNKILRGELCFGIPLFFSKNHGVVVVSSVDSFGESSICESPMGSPCPSEIYDGHLSLYEIDPHDVSLITTDIVGKLKTAFLYHVKRDTALSVSIIEELFPRPVTSEPVDVDAALDRTIVTIARELIDDVPAGDPRWNFQGSGFKANIPLGSSSALQILLQLKDKQQAFDLFVDFLKVTGLWNRLGLVSRESGDGTLYTKRVLCELRERIVAAIALRKLQQNHPILDAAIHQVINNDWDWESSDIEQAVKTGVLSVSDVLYRRVSQVWSVLLAVLDWCKDNPNTDHLAFGQMLHNANIVILGVMREVCACRAEQTSDGAGGGSGSHTWLSALTHHHTLTLQTASQLGADVTLRSQLYDQAVSLAEYALTELKECSDETGTAYNRQLYQETRQNMIKLYLDDKQYSRAAIIAEKFRDFDKLIELCIKCNDMKKLQGYMEKYTDEGFCERTFSRLCEWGLGGTTLNSTITANPEIAERLIRWASKTSDRAGIVWPHALSMDQHDVVVKMLVELIVGHYASVARLTTAASLAKLNLLSVDEDSLDPDQITQIRRQIENTLILCEHHNNLPRSILISHGLEDEYKSGKMRVYSPNELVDMYVTSEDQGLNEYDYKKALDLTDFIDDVDERALLRMKVWCASILQDDWREYKPDAPLETVHDKIFFKLLDLLNILGANIYEYLPSIDDIINAPELEKLSSEKGFQFILKYGYEYLDKSQGEDYAMNE